MPCGRQIPDIEVVVPAAEHEIDLAVAVDVTRGWCTADEVADAEREAEQLRAVSLPTVQHSLLAAEHDVRQVVTVEVRDDRAALRVQVRRLRPTGIERAVPAIDVELALRRI